MNGKAEVREAFEDYAIHTLNYSREHLLTREDNGKYRLELVQEKWEDWQSAVSWIMGRLRAAEN